VLKFSDDFQKSEQKHQQLQQEKMKETSGLDKHNDNYLEKQMFLTFSVNKVFQENIFAENKTLWSRSPCFTHPCQQMQNEVKV